ncbi:hypothetical protein ACFLQN_03490 [Candidatus Aenigmatarchaeota archaeon]
MKGIFWDLMIMILTLGIFIGIVPVTFSMVGETFRIDARINVEEIVGIINFLESSPTKTQQSYFLPKSECLLTIKNYDGFAIVNLTVKMPYGERNQTAIGYPIIPDNVQIVSNEEGIMCSDSGEKRIFIQRCENEITITETEVNC